MKYLHAKDHRDYPILHYKVDLTEEFWMKWTQKLGPIDVESDEGEDIVFTLEDIDGIFVSSKKDTVILEFHD